MTKTPDWLIKVKRKPKAYKKLMKRKRIYKKVEKSVAKRRAAEKRLKFYGILAISISFLFLISLMFNIISNGYTAFISTEVKLPITFTKKLVDSDNFHKMVKTSLKSSLPNVKTRRDRLDLYATVSKSAPHHIKKILEENPEYLDKTVDIWVLASSNVDMLMKGKIDRQEEESKRKLNNKQIEWITHLEEEERIRKTFNTTFFTQGDSREPEMAGVLGSIVGSVLVILSCMLFAFPLGVMTAIYLEEFAPKNKFTDFIEVNISNLAAVPSIVFGLLGLAVYLQVFGVPRSTPLAGGLTLALMALPIIVIATRTSIRAIPQTIRDGAMALGASKVQTVLHHVLPLAMPGIMTGSILSIARVLGETAPLLMIGLNAFVVDVPEGFLDAATVMPTQIYRWADSPEIGFAEKTSAAIIILLLLLIITNALAVYLRKKFEIRW